MTTERRPRSPSELTEAQCWELLDASTIGRLAFHTSSGLTIRPVNYVVHDQTLIIRTDPAGSIAAIADTEHDVAFEADYHDATGGTGWSVVMSGTVASMSMQQVSGLHLDQRVRPWVDGDRSLHIRFIPRTIGGRRVRRHR